MRNFDSKVRKGRSEEMEVDKNGIGVKEEKQ